MTKYKISLIGCGYVAYFYAKCIAKHPRLDITIAYDSDSEKQNKFCSTFGVASASSFQNIIEEEAHLVLNLTSIASHNEINTILLRHGKNIFSEKPVVENLEEFEELMNLCGKSSGNLFCAPTISTANYLSIVKKTINNNTLGKLLHVKLQYEVGLIHLKEPWLWKQNDTVFFPAEDEFRHGMVIEHAPYLLDILFEIFGETQRIYQFATNLIEDRLICTTFAIDHLRQIYQTNEGVTCEVDVGSNTPESRSAVFTFEYGYLIIPDIRNENYPVLIRDFRARKLKRSLVFRFENLIKKTLALMNIFALNDNLAVHKTIPVDNVRNINSGKPVDFCSYIFEITQALEHSDDAFIEKSYQRMKFIHGNLLS